MKIHFLMLGKTRRAEARSLLEDYSARIRRYAEVDLVELKDGSAASLRNFKPDSAAQLVLLDAAGVQFTSAQFARWLGEMRDRGAPQLVFLCGDAQGFPEALRLKVRHKFSLSTLTMPHEFARVVLAEQVYRAFSILAGHPYAK